MIYGGGVSLCGPYTTEEGPPRRDHAPDPAVSAGGVAAEHADALPDVLIIVVVIIA